MRREQSAGRREVVTSPTRGLAADVSGTAARRNCPGQPGCASTPVKPAPPRSSGA